MQARFKGLIDRTFLSGFAFKYEKCKTIPKRLLQGRISELIITMDKSPLWYQWVQGNVIYNQLKKTILFFQVLRMFQSSIMDRLQMPVEYRLVIGFLV